MFVWQSNCCKWEICFFSAVKSRQELDFKPEVDDAVSPTPETTCKGVWNDSIYIIGGGGAQSVIKQVNYC